MAEPKNRWTWEVPGFEPRRSYEHDELQGSSAAQAVVRRLSVSPLTLLPRAEAPPRASVAAKLQRLKEQVKHARNDYLELRQEATDLREYSSAKLDRVTRYLGFLADRARKLDQAALETEARITPLINEKKRLFNELLTSKGNLKVYCRTRPLFEEEGSSVVEFPDDFTIRVNTGDDSLANPKKDYEFDRVYGPHVGQGELFHDVQPFIQSALDGYNVCLFAYGQTHSGKTHTMVRDLLLESRSAMPRVRMGPEDSFVELVQKRVQNPLDFSGVLSAALKKRGTDSSKAIVSHLLGDVLSSLTSKKEIVPYENSRMTQILADSLGSGSKTLLIARVCPSALNLPRTLSTLNFSARARNAELSLGNRDTTKKWRDVANDSRKELQQKEREVQDLRNENLQLKLVLDEANDQCTLLFNEVQKAWKVSFTLQADLKSENLMLADKQKAKKEQNNQLKNQVAYLLQLEQEQKMQIHERDLTIKSLQAKLRTIETQLNEALNSSDSGSTRRSESGSTGVLSTPKREASVDSSSVMKKLEEELSKRDALIEKMRSSLTGLQRSQD